MNKNNIIYEVIMNWLSTALAGGQNDGGTGGERVSRALDGIRNEKIRG